MVQRRSSEAAVVRRSVRMEGPRHDAKGRPVALRAADNEADGNTARGATFARTARALRSGGAANHAEGRPGAGAADRQAGERETGDPHPAPHVLFAPGDAWRAGTRHPGAGRTPGPGDDAALHAPESGRARRGDQAVGDRNGGGARRRGEIMEAAGTEGLEGPYSLR